MMLELYTDGSCSKNPGPGGYSIIGKYNNTIYYIYNYKENSTNNEMELQAMLEAIKFSLLFENKKVIIYSDSAYVINSINQHWIDNWARNDWLNSEGKPIKNREIWQKIYLLLQYKNSIQFIKVKGHVGIRYNEMADKLAKFARDRKVDGIQISRSEKDCLHQKRKL